MTDLTPTPAEWPDKTMTLRELIAELTTEEAPHLDDAVAELLRKHPELRKKDGGFMLGRIAAISILNFLCRAYGRPDLGYLAAPARNRKAEN